jgi:hypothetical protein
LEVSGAGLDQVTQQRYRRLLWLSARQRRGALAFQHPISNTASYGGNWRASKIVPL